MTAERWQRIKPILDASLDLRGEQRQAYLDRMCGGEPALRREVESLIASYESSTDVLETPALERNAAAVLEAIDGPAPGARLGHYEIVEEIGRGGMGTVYRAVRADQEYRKQVAIKVVRRGDESEFIIRRFRNERQIMASLEHPNIARMLDGGTTEDGRPYFVMEFIEGEPIDRYCDRRRLNTRERLQVFCTVCGAVQYAHRKLVIHRDIKPGNILITQDGVPKLLDFGIAKILDPEGAAGDLGPTVTVFRMMTPEYASPEQVRGEAITAASDIYSLGVLLYQLLTGHRPYRLRSRSPHELARAICEDAPDRPSTAVGRIETASSPGEEEPITISPESVSRDRDTIPERLRRSLAGDLDNILLTALRKEPDRRYQSAAAFAADIRRHLEGKPVLARKDSIGYRVWKFVQQRRAAAIAAALLVIGVAASAFLWRSGPVFSQAPPRVFPLTSFPGDEAQPAFSPDGKKLAFVWAGESGENQDIYVKSVAGEGLLRLTTDPAQDTSPTWSPDGKFIAFLRSSRTETALFVSPAEGGVHRKMADIFPYRLEASGIEANGRPAVWSPDGRYIAVGDRTSTAEPFSIYFISARNGTKDRMTLPPERNIGDRNPAFSPDGRLLSFVRAPSSGVTDLYVQAVSGGQPRRLTFDNRDILAQTWSPDGRWIVFSSNRTGSYQLWRIPAGGGAPARLPGIGNGVSDPTFTADGQRLGYSQFFLDTNIWRIRPGSPPRKLIVSTQFDSSPQYSPDGRRIVFRSSRSGSHEIWVSDAEGLNAVKLTDFNGPLTGTPRWSPDGKWIAFDSRPEGQADIYVISGRGGRPRRVTTEPSEDVVPSWSRDGRWIYFASNRTGTWQVWKKAADGSGSAEQVTRNGGFAAFEAPDGKFLYYAKGRSVPGLWRRPLRGAAVEEQVLDRLRAGFWGYWGLAPDGIYFLEEMPDVQKRLIYFLGYGARVPKEVAGIEKRPMVGDSAFAVSPDGRSILYTQIDQSGSDIMVADYAPSP